jgi:hypothetical protein
MNDGSVSDVSFPPRDYRRLTWLAVGLLLAAQALLLAGIGYRKSPGVDEPAHLAAGLSHWKFGRFDLYRVNPPLVRMVATLPLVALPLFGVEPQTDWSAFTEAPYARPEFALGSAFTSINGFESFWYFTLCRWALIPIVLLGGLVCFLWGRDLYGTPAGFTALILWAFCPNVLGNGAMITPDVGGAALGVTAGYTFWRWLRVPCWKNTFLAGLALGLAELSKSTWIVLFAIWPLLWVMWAVTTRRQRLREQVDSDGSPPSEVSGLLPGSRSPDACGFAASLRLVAILFVALYLLNLGYGYEGTFRQLKEFQFISRALGGREAHETPGNRFADSWLGELPVPVPSNYLAGIDVQRYDFEKKKWSYLRGEQKLGGWWYYYLYAMAVKMPVGTLALIAFAFVASTTRLGRAVRSQPAGVRHARRPPFLDDFILLAPGLVVLTLVSSQTGFSRYLRYVVPAFPFLYIWACQVVRLPRAGDHGSRDTRSGRRLSNWFSIPTMKIAGSAVCLLGMIASSLSVYPHSLSYFNEIAGGPANGPAHLLDANIDWGQDLLELKRWYNAHPEARPLYLAWFGFVDPKLSGMEFTQAPPLGVEATGEDATDPNPVPPARWYAISVNELYAYQHYGPRLDDYAWLRQHRPVAHAGHSIRIFHIGEVKGKRD